MANNLNLVGGSLEGNCKQVTALNPVFQTRIVNFSKKTRRCVLLYFTKNVHGYQFPSARLCCILAFTYRVSQKKPKTIEMTYC